MRRLVLRRFRATAAAVALALLLAAPATAATFAAKPASLGSIPDGLSGSCPSPQTGAPRIVSFPVKGLKDTITNVEVTMTFVHPWGGDISAVLIAPNGVSHTIFGRTGSTTGSQCGDGSDLSGPYTFSDRATVQPDGGWWPAAAADVSSAIPAGTYRSVGLGGPAVPTQPEFTSITPTFAGVPPNGAWRLVLSDALLGDSGSITAASLKVVAKDTIPPSTWFAQRPRKTTTATRATFKFKSNEAAAKFRCKIARKWRPCGTTKTFTVGRGAHTLRVRAVDPAGNRDATPAEYTWRVVAP